MPAAIYGAIGYDPAESWRFGDAHFMSVDSGASVAVMSAQKPAAAKIGHAFCHKTNGKIMV